MSFDIGPRIGIEGDKEFKKSILEINDSMKVLKSEMAAVTSQFDKNDKSSQALTAQNSVLTKQIELQKEKVAQLEAALKNAANTYGENDKVTKNWQIQLNNARAELNQMERNLESNNKAMDDAGESAEKSGEKFEKFKGILAGVGAAVASVTAAAGAAAVKLAKDVIDQFGELEQNLGGSEAVFGEHAEKIQKIAEDAYKNMGVSQSQYLQTANKMGALFQGSGLEQEKAMELTTKAMQRAADVASVMGIDMQMALDSIAGAAKGNFTMMDNLGVAMNATTIEAYALSKGLVKVSDASVDMKKVADAQDKVTQATLNVQSAQEKYNAAVEKYGKDSTQAKQASIALSKAQANLESANRKLTEAMEPAQKEMSSWWQNASQAEKAEVAMQMFFERTEQYAGNFARESTQTITGSIGMLQAAYTSFLGGLGNANADITNLSKNIVDAFGATVKNIEPVIKNIAKSLPDAISAILPEISNMLPELLQTATELFEEVLQALLQMLPQLVPVVVSGLMMIVEAIINNMPLLIDAAIQIILALVNGLSQALPNLIPAAVEAILTIVEGLVDNLPQLIDAAIELVTALAQGIIDALPILLEKAPEIIKKLIEGITDAIPKLVDAAIDIIMALVDFLLDPENLALLVKGALEIIIAIAGGLIKAQAELAKAVPKLVKKLIDKFMETDWGEIGINILKGIGEGLLSGVTGLIDTVKDVAGSIFGGFKSFFGIQSPSKLFRDDIGKMLGFGLAEGLEDSMSRVKRAVNEMNNEIAIGAGIGNSANRTTNNYYSYGPSMIRVEVPVDGHIVAGAILPTVSRSLSFESMERAAALG